MYSCVLSCTLLCVLCFCVVLRPCPMVYPVPCLPCLWCACVVLWLWCVGMSCPCSPCPCGCVLRCTPAPPVLLLSYFLWIIPALYMGWHYMRALYTPYICALFFLLAIYDPFCTHNKSRPLDSECRFPKVGLNFRCSVFSFVEFSR